MSDYIYIIVFLGTFVFGWFVGRKYEYTRIFKHWDAKTDVFDE